MEIWTKTEVIERIALLNGKYYLGYIEQNPDAAIHKFKALLKMMNAMGCRDNDNTGYAV